MSFLRATLGSYKTATIRVFALTTVILPGALTPAWAAHDEKGQLFDGPGGKLYYEVIGSGNATPLVLVNGGPGFDHTYFHTSPAWDSLAKNRRVIFYDQRGNGRSAALKPGQSCTLADQIDDLEALRAHLGVEKMDLLGGSWGGYLSMAYAARHPDRIAHLILVDSAAPKWSETIFLFDQVFPETTERQAGGAFAREFGDKAAEDASIREYLSMIFYSPEKRDAYMARMGDLGYEPAVARAISKATKNLDLTPKLAGFRFPTLVITGRYDMNVVPLTAWRMVHAIPAAKIVFFEKSGHLPSYEEPDKYRTVLETFLNEH